VPKFLCLHDCIRPGGEVATKDSLVIVCAAEAEVLRQSPDWVGPIIDGREWTPEGMARVVAEEEQLAQAYEALLRKMQGAVLNKMDAATVENK